MLDVPFGNLECVSFPLRFLYCQYLDPAGTGCLPSDVSPDEVHSCVFKSAKALYVNTHDRQLVSKALKRVSVGWVFPL